MPAFHCYHGEVEGIDPADLDFGRLARAQTHGRNAAWRAAADHGIDVLLLEENRLRTPAERMLQLEESLRLMGR